MQRLVDVGFGAGPTERKHEFLATTVTQDRMEEGRRRQNGTLGDAKVGRDVLRVGWIVDEGRMPDRIRIVLVDPRIQRREVIVGQLFVFYVKTYRIGSTSKETSRG